MQVIKNSQLDLLIPKIGNPNNYKLSRIDEEIADENEDEYYIRNIIRIIKKVLIKGKMILFKRSLIIAYAIDQWFEDAVKKQLQRQKKIFCCSNKDMQQAVIFFGISKNVFKVFRGKTEGKRMGYKAQNIILTYSIRERVFFRPDKE
ncbi:unnamed protein product [Paramecium sonneborni]|uniref:Uncharacterized protein n=1 Tax=Paramecium sonneborni TaxID=65129 RepID=A0A8S1NMT4_9CILI|nr:unnamed protein product [Paramecium sonneborni]